MTHKQMEAVKNAYAQIGHEPEFYPDYKGDRFRETMDALTFEDQLREVSKLPPSERRLALAKLRAGVRI